MIIIRHQIIVQIKKKLDCTSTMIITGFGSPHCRIPDLLSGSFINCSDDIWGNYTQITLNLTKPLG